MDVPSLLHVGGSVLTTVGVSPKFLKGLVKYVPQCPRKKYISFFKKRLVSLDGNESSLWPLWLRFWAFLGNFCETHFNTFQHNSTHFNTFQPISIYFNTIQNILTLYGGTTTTKHFEVLQVFISLLNSRVQQYKSATQR